jgi:hypothetical protein
MLKVVLEVPTTATKNSKKTTKKRATLQVKEGVEEEASKRRSQLAHTLRLRRLLGLQRTSGVSRAATAITTALTAEALIRVMAAAMPALIPIQTTTTKTAACGYLRRCLL